MPKVWINGAWEEADPEYAPNVYINSVAPSSPLIGTFWYDTLAGGLKIWNGSVWNSTNSPDDSQSIIAQRMFA